MFHSSPPPLPHVLTLSLEEVRREWPSVENSTDLTDPVCALNTVDSPLLQRKGRRKEGWVGIVTVPEARPGLVSNSFPQNSKIQVYVWGGEGILILNFQGISSLSVGESFIPSYGLTNGKKKSRCDRAACGRDAELCMRN